MEGNLGSTQDTEKTAWLLHIWYYQGRSDMLGPQL